jgi:hypothetical protein
MAVEGLIDFDELRTRLAALEDSRKIAEDEATHPATPHGVEQLENDGDTLLGSYARLMPDKVDALSPEERRQVYRMIGLEVHWAPNGSFGLSGNVISFSNVVISSA